MINAWKHSGIGSVMLEEEPDDKVSVEEVYNFVDGDDWQAFLMFANNKIHLLYFLGPNIQTPVAYKCKGTLERDNQWKWKLYPFHLFHLKFQWWQEFQWRQ
jgi:hypothetical protein